MGVWIIRPESTVPNSPARMWFAAKERVRDAKCGSGAIVVGDVRVSVRTGNKGKTKIDTTVFKLSDVTRKSGRRGSSIRRNACREMIPAEHLNVCRIPTSKIVIFRDVRLYRANAAKKKVGGLVIRPPLADLQSGALEFEITRFELDVGKCYYRKQTRATGGDRRIGRHGCPRIGELDGRHAIRKGRHRRPFVAPVDHGRDSGLYQRARAGGEMQDMTRGRRVNELRRAPCCAVQ